GAARRAPVHAVVVAIQVLTRERGLGAGMAEHLVLSGRQLPLPLIVRLGHFGAHAAPSPGSIAPPPTPPPPGSVPCPAYCWYPSTVDSSRACALAGSSPNSRRARRWRSRSQH